MSATVLNPAIAKGSAKGRTRATEKKREQALAAAVADIAEFLRTCGVNEHAALAVALKNALGLASPDGRRALLAQLPHWSARRRSPCLRPSFFLRWKPPYATARKSRKPRTDSPRFTFARAPPSAPRRAKPTSAGS
jgi:hypothetical protein